jgi:glycosidase
MSKLFSLTLRSSLVLLFLTGFHSGFSQVDNIYNDDPEQRIPLGVDRPVHRHITADGGTVDQARVEPPFWWVDMAEPELEILIYEQDVRDSEVIIQYPGVQLKGVTRLQNPNYLFVRVELTPWAKPGTMKIQLKKGGETKTIDYPLLSRTTNHRIRPSLTNADVIYLLMPDRFANGDPTNDSVEGMTQQGVNRDKMFFRHGGDLKGILDHLDYLEDLGITAIWINPVLENDQPFESYHGYAITDHYQIDRRFGSNEEYLQLVEACHQRGIKVIMDVIFNHVGDQHFLIKDLPSEDWIHQYDEYTRTTFRAPTLMDPYASKADQDLMANGWFDHHMPDLNQHQPQLANYLIQNSIWWIEYSGQDAYRIDTYAYPDQDFMAEWGRRLQEEYPWLSFFGETWVHGPGVQAQFTEDNQLREGYNSFLPSVTDFQLHYAIIEAVKQPQGWTSGAARIYYSLAQDFLYEDPYRNIVFLDNHDVSRFYSETGGDVRKLKLGLTFLLTTRGIPMIYYGTEILMDGLADPDGLVREDFPGGWEGDPVNKFEESGRTESEQDVFAFTRDLIRFRTNTPALQDGKLTQFVPVDGVYVYFRYDEEHTVMIILNTHDQQQELATDRFKELLDGYSSAEVVGTGQRLNSLKNINLPPYSAMVLNLK